MRERRRRDRFLVGLVAVLASSLPVTFVSAAPDPARSAGNAPALPQAMFTGDYAWGASNAPVRPTVFPKWGSKGRRSGYAGGPGLQCVPFARDASGIELTGNAWLWWDAAAGIYERGNVPEPGSILAFRANGSMRLGHVAVVSRVVNDREIEIDHANWGYRGSVTRGVAVVDVSPNNNWTAVRVSLPDGESFGSTYLTHGFIYGRPDRGTTLVARAASPPQANANTAATAARDGGATTEPADGAPEEVAEAPAPRRQRKYGHTAR